MKPPEVIRPRSQRVAKCKTIVAEYQDAELPFAFGDLRDFIVSNSLHHRTMTSLRRLLALIGPLAANRIGFLSDVVGTAIHDDLAQFQHTCAEMPIWANQRSLACAVDASGRPDPGMRVELAYLDNLSGVLMSRFRDIAGKPMP